MRLIRCTCEAPLIMSRSQGDGALSHRPPVCRIDIEQELRLAIPGDKGLAIQRAFSEMEFAQHGRRLKKIHKRLHGVASI